MATVFENVEADISDDLVGRFSQEFDFDAMLRKVCEDAGVVVLNNIDVGDFKPGKYRLKGLWLSMEKAYKQLVTALALYGSRQPHIATENNKQLGISQSGTISYEEETIESFGPLADEENGHDYIPAVANILQDIIGGSERKKQRRPRKSARQSRKFDLHAEEQKSVDIQLGEQFPQSAEIVKSDNNDGKSVAGMAESNTAQENVAPEEEDDGGDDFDTSPNGTETKQSKGNMPQRNVPSKSSVAKVASTRQRQLKRSSALKKSKMITVGPKSSSEDVSTPKKRGRPKQPDSDVGMELECPDCDFVAKHKSKLRSHQLRMHLSAPTKCDVCAKVFPNRRYMLRHRASHVEPQHCCDVCGKMYKIRKAMLDHRRTHDAAYERPKFKCEQCTKTFCNRYILECHVRDIHMGQKKSYLCSVCGKSFTTKHSLKEHSDAHTGVKPHVCEICGKSFSYESALRDHRFTHTDSKQFWCKHCEKAFSQRSGLKMHMRIHKQNKMFVCSECGRGFTQKQALQRHERVHKGEKPFVCKHCGRFFTDASIIRRHLILVHKIKKNAKDWREDIICTVKSTNEYHVQKIGEEESATSEAEKAKEEIMKAVGVQPRPNNNKGPSRAFSRTYPRRVAILDDEGNVIAPPEAPPISLSRHSKDSSSESTSTAARKKTVLNASGNSNPPILLTTSEGSSDLDSTTQVLNQRYMDTTQWDAITSQLRSANATHIEHIILEDTTTQPDLQRSIEQVPSLHKIIKYENIPGLPAASSTHILSQPHGQAAQSPSSSPLAFVTQSSSNTRSLDTQFDTLTPQAAQSGCQYYDGRSSGPASSAQWSSMFYYSQLASQFGMSINPEYTYVSSSTSGNAPAPQLTPYLSQASTDAHTATATALILHSQPHGLTHIDSPNPEHSSMQEEASPHQGNATSLTSAVSNPGQSVVGSDSVTLHQNSEVIQITHLPAELKLSNSPDAGQSLHQADMMLQQDLPQIVGGPQDGSAHTHSLSAEEAQHHMAAMEQVTGGLANQQTILVRPLDLPVSAAATSTDVSSPSKQSPTTIPELSATVDLPGSALKQE